MIIGFTGLKHSGKDTAALALLDKGWERVAFADPVREMLYVLNPYVAEMPWSHPRKGLQRWAELIDALGYDVVKDMPEARRLMKTFATEVMRDMVDQDFWLNLGLKKIDQLDIDARDVAITDVRFDNEAKAIFRREGHVILIVRPGLENDDDHVSEAGVNLRFVNHTIINDGSIEDLHGKVRDVLEHV